MLGSAGSPGCGTRGDAHTVFVGLMDMQADSGSTGLSTLVCFGSHSAMQRDVSSSVSGGFPGRGPLPRGFRGPSWLAGRSQRESKCRSREPESSDLLGELQGMCVTGARPAMGPGKMGLRGPAGTGKRPVDPGQEARNAWTLLIRIA